MSEEKSLPKREEIPEEDRWDLSHLFKSEDDWEDLFQKLEKNIENYKRYKGKLKESIDVFVEAIEFDLQISREIDQLHTFAHLKSDEDKTNQHNLGLYQQSLNLSNRASELSSFMTPEIQSIPDDTISTYLQDKKLREYRFYLEKILRFKPHTLNQESEELLSFLVSLITQTSNLEQSRMNGEI
jgi:oligoendopeptidase F